jgi:large subunit ribosomal protein L25
MAETVTLKAQVRDGKKLGSNYSRNLRKGGFLPAVLYGHKEETIPVIVPKEDFIKALNLGTRIIELQTDGKSEITLIREVQWDAFGHEVLHVDFARVSADERITVEVPIEVKGTAAGVTAGGILDQPMHSLEIECPAFSVPDAIRVNIANLQVEEAIHVKDLKLPEGVTTQADPDGIVVHVLQPAEEIETVPGLAAEQAEPELIKKPKTEEEGGE